MKRLILTLTIIGLISALALAFVYQLTLPIIEEHQAETKKEAILAVLPESDSYKEVVKKGVIFYEGNIEGEIAMSVKGGGFQGEIELMLGANPYEGKIYAIKVISHSETPGLGANIIGEKFERNFLDKPFGEYLVVKRPVANSTEVEAISGATISTQKVTDIVSEAIKQMKLAYGGED